jgi:hypothetical protein
MALKLPKLSLKLKIKTMSEYADDSVFHRPMLDPAGCRAWKSMEVG